MMLADHIIQARGTPVDMGGQIGSMANVIERAQRFAVDRETAEAALQLLKARPSGLVKVMPVCRLPYSTMWVETAGGFSDEASRDRVVAPIPLMQGTLIEAFGDRRGVMTCAWVHRPRPGVSEHHAVNASPYALYFDFREDGDAGVLVAAAHDRIKAQWGNDRDHIQAIDMLCDGIQTKFSLPSTDEGITRFMQGRSWWTKWAHDKREIESLREHDRHMRVGLSPHGPGAVMAALDLGVKSQSDFFIHCMRNWESDIEGEGPFAQFFIAMLNSRNCVEQEPVSMAKLNKARAKRRSDKPALLDFTKIKLVMSKTRARVARARGLSPEITREQLVMGHFKTRRTGVFWWNEFERYTDRGLEPSQRQRYEVEA